MGAHEQSIASQAIRAGQPIPDRILNAPELEQGLVFFLQAFLYLDTERSHHAGPTRIPWSCIMAYATYMECDSEQTADLVYFISEMDEHVVNKVAEHQKAERAKEARNARTKPKRSR